jgi:hypothetical protein
MAQQSYIQRVPGCNRSMRINNRATSLCPRPMFIVKFSYQGIKVSRYQGTKVSRYQGIKVSRYQGIKVSRYQGTKVSRYQGIKVSRYQGIKVSRYQGIKVSRYQGIKCHIHCPKQTQNHSCFQYINIK